jgi:hypothetical protein
MMCCNCELFIALCEARLYFGFHHSLWRVTPEDNFCTCVIVCMLMCACMKDRTSLITEPHRKDRIQGSIGSSGEWLGCRLNDPGLEFWQGQGIYLFSKNVQTASGTQPSSFSVGIGCPFPWWWNWPLTPQCWGWGWVELCLHLSLHNFVACLVTSLPLMFMDPCIIIIF